MPECRVDDDCGSALPCEERRCEGGACQRRPLPPGTPAREQIPNDCRTVVCGASGEALLQVDPADLPRDDGNVCTVERCGEAGPILVPASHTRCQGDGVCGRSFECIRLKALAGSESRLCAIEGEIGQVRCQNTGFLPFPTPVGADQTGKSVDAVEIAVSGQNTCIRTRQRHVECWGGLIGLGRPSFNNEPPVGEANRIRISDVDDAVEIAASESQFCARMADGEVRCWGMMAGIRRVPGLRAVKIGASRHHFCALNQGGEVWCWGVVGTSRGESVTTDKKPERVAVVRDAVSMTVGPMTTCVTRKTGGLTCWGVDSPDGHVEGSWFGPRAMPGVESVVAVALGSVGGCAQEQSGKVKCFDHLGPVKEVAGLRGATEMLSAMNNVVARLPGGEVVLWSPYGTPPLRWIDW